MLPDRTAKALGSHTALSPRGRSHLCTAAHGLWTGPQELVRVTRVCECMPTPQSHSVRDFGQDAGSPALFSTSYDDDTLADVTIAGPATATR